MTIRSTLQHPGLALGTLLLPLLAACHEEHHSHHELGRFTATTPMRTAVELPREFVCQIRAQQHIELRALERGYLEKVHVDEGQFVEKGEPMFQIMPRVYQAELDVANAEAEYARIEYENAKLLLEKDVISPPEVALAKARLTKALAEAGLRETHLSLATIQAPFSGLMDRLLVREGSLLEEGELLTSLNDSSKVWVYFNVPEVEYIRYRKRKDREGALPVKLRLANGELFDQDGVVDTIEGEFHNDTGTIAFRATFPNPDGLLRHGQTGNIVVTTRLEDVLLIPQAATFEVLDKRFVWVVDEAEHVHAREITIRAEKPHLYVVGAGLAEGDRFLVEGLRRVQEGDGIEIDLESPADVFARLAVPAE